MMGEIYEKGIPNPKRSSKKKHLSKSEVEVLRAFGYPVTDEDRDR